MHRLLVLMVGGVLLSMGLSSSVALAEQMTPAFKELQDKYRQALEEIERLQSELDQAKRAIDRLQPPREQAQVSQPQDGVQNDRASVVKAKYRDAIVALTRALEANPGEATSYRKRGIAYAQLGDYQRARQDFTRAIELDPQDAVAYNQRGITAYQLGNAQQALEDFSNAIDRNPKLAQSYNNRGIVHKKLGDSRQARADFRSAAQLGLEVAPRHLQVLRDEVQRAQELLHTAGFDPGPVDGLPGAQTTAALRHYQRSQNLPSTGWLDDATKQALGMQPATPSAPPPGGLETAPRFVHQPRPEYPVLARQQGLEGTVTLHIELLADGTVGAVDIAQSSGHPVLDTAAQNAVQHWTHSPVTDQGTPVSRWLRLNVHFALDKEPEAGQETEDRGAQPKDQG